MTYAGVYMHAVYTGFNTSCADKPLSLYALGSDFNETTTWNTRPLPVGPALSTITYGRQPWPNGAGAYCPPGWVREGRELSVLATVLISSRMALIRIGTLAQALSASRW